MHEDTVVPRIGDKRMARIAETLMFDLVVEPFEARGRGERAFGYK